MAENIYIHTYILYIVTNSFQGHLPYIQYTARVEHSPECIN